MKKVILLSIPLFSFLFFSINVEASSTANKVNSLFSSFQSNMNSYMHYASLDGYYAKVRKIMKANKARSDADKIAKHLNNLAVGGAQSPHKMKILDNAWDKGYDECKVETTYCTYLRSSTITSFRNSGGNDAVAMLQGGCSASLKKGIK